MWDDVKPITMLLKQNNKDGSYFGMHFYSNDYELIKLREATHFNENGDIIGSYSRLPDVYETNNLTLNYFIERLDKTTISKLIQYYENPNLFVEYLY